VLLRKNEKSDDCKKKGLTVDTVSDKLRPRSMELLKTARPKEKNSKLYKKKA